MTASSPETPRSPSRRFPRLPEFTILRAKPIAFFSLATAPAHHVGGVAALTVELPGPIVHAFTAAAELIAIRRTMVLPVTSPTLPSNIPRIVVVLVMWLHVFSRAAIFTGLRSELPTSDQHVRIAPTIEALLRF